jgi:hypothetical protein
MRDRADDSTHGVGSGKKKGSRFGCFGILRWPDPIAERARLRASNDKGSGWRVFSQGRAGSEGRSTPHAHRSDELGITTDKNIIFNYSTMLVGTIIITGDRTRADIDPLTDRTVAHVRQVVCFCVGTEAAIFDLDEIADMDPGTKLSARA